MDWIPFDERCCRSRFRAGRYLLHCDEEHVDGARITLERDGHIAPFSITCGIYGWMVHTCFFSTQQRAEADFKRMKNELASIVAIISFEDDPDLENKLAPVSDAISRFVEEYW